MMCLRWCHVWLVSISAKNQIIKLDGSSLHLVSPICFRQLLSCGKCRPLAVARVEESSHDPWELSRASIGASSELAPILAPGSSLLRKVIRFVASTFSCEAHAWNRPLQQLPVLLLVVVASSSEELPIAHWLNFQENNLWKTDGRNKMQSTSS